MIELQMFPELEKTASCNMCGKCCESILIQVSPEDLQNPKNRYKDREFMAANFKPMTKETALSINPDLVDPRHPDEGFYYSCEKYDKESKLCTAHEERPHTCYSFPFYDSPINNQSLLMHKSCSYWLDVPVEAWPEGVNV